MSENEETIDSLRQKLRVAERVKQAAIDCTKSWDTILDELVWERQDLDKHEIPADHLQTMIARYPHYAEDLRGFVDRWNADKPLSDEELDAMEVDEEEVKRSTASCLLMLKWSDRIRKAERERDEAVAERDALKHDIDRLMEANAYELQRADALAARVAEAEADANRLLHAFIASDDERLASIRAAIDAALAAKEPRP